MSGILNGLIGAAIGALVAWVGTLLTVKFQYKDMYSRTVSSNRMEWINNFREEIGIIVACLKTPASCAEIFEAEKARAKLLTRLNMDTSREGNELNAVFSQHLEEIDFRSVNSQSESAEVTECLIILTRDILEPEWQRVKEEAKGRKR